jgi:hypothetical protein
VVKFSLWLVAGDDEYGGYNYLTEIYDPATKSISVSYNPSGNGTYCVGSGATSTCPGAGTPCYGGPNQGVGPFLALYPRMSLMPSGLVFASGSLQKTYLWDPSGGVWTFVNNTSQTYRDYGASILLPLQNTSNERGKVLIVGGTTSGSTAATNVVEIEDFNQGTSTAPLLRTVASLHFARKFLLPIILPDGKVVIFGGSSQGTTNPIYIPEMFDPENESQGWVTLLAAMVPRVYHGTALLLPDGSVWTASSTVNACTTELRTEIFKPSYFSATRPTISGTPTVGGYGQTITIPTPNPSSISRVSLVRLGATTHHYEANVRLVWLQITGTSSNSITVSAPLNGNLAPPGYYMIHVLDSSLVPSIARIIKIPGTGGGGSALILNPISSVPWGTAVKVTGKLTDLSTGSAIGGATIAFTGTGAANLPKAITASDGTFSTSGKAPNTVATGWTVQAQYGGGGIHASTNSPVQSYNTVKHTALLTLIVPTNVPFGTKVTVTGKLVDNSAGGTALASRPITFTSPNGSPLPPSVLTKSDGTYSSTFTAKTYITTGWKLQAHFAGTTGINPAASTVQSYNTA